MNIVIPMAGKGSRFSEAGYVDPKPLIVVKDNLRMVEAVIQSINIKANYIFICHTDHRKYHLESIFDKLDIPSYQIIWTEETTQGAACSVLLAKELINNCEPLIIVNSDQILEWSSEHFLKYVDMNLADSAILTFNISGNDNKWSFVRLSSDPVYICEVKEKVQISNIATAGLYYFNSGEVFVNSAESMIAANDRTNGEFYVAPVYNYVIGAGYNVMNYPIPTIYATGTPDDLATYINSRHWKWL